MTTHLPSVSIVIPAYNEARIIRRCIIAALHQTVAPHEIIVVDNLSTDDTVEVVRDLMGEFPQSGIRLVHQSLHQGIIPTRNYGFNAATGDVIGRIDADSIVDHEWVEAVQTVFADEEVMAATGPVSYHDMPLRKLGLEADNKVRRFVSSLAQDYQFLFGSNMAIRRSAWEAIATEVCYDPDNQMHEDIDMSIHLSQHDLKVVYAPTMVGGMSARRLRDSPKEYRHYVRRFERTYANHAILNPALRVPMVIYLAIYYPLKALQALYDKDGETARINSSQ